MKQITKGALTFLPGIGALLDRRGSGGTASAEYCYDVWLKHLTLLHEAGMECMPSTVAEIGPGGTLGVGIAALLSGATRCIGLDVVEYADVEKNLRILDELVLLMRERHGRFIKGWPNYDEYLPDSLFPNHILNDELLGRSLADERVDAIREALIHMGETIDGISVSYHVPWSSPKVISTSSVDLVLSHSTMEHVEDLELAYYAMAEWCADNAWCSHQIDYTSHGLMSDWDGYRTYSEAVWKIIKGKRAYLINRAPHSEHLRLLSKNGFHVKAQWLNKVEKYLAKNRLAKRWCELSEDDRASQGSFVVCKFGKIA